MGDDSISLFGWHTHTQPSCRQRWQTDSYHQVPCHSHMLAAGTLQGQQQEESRATAWLQRATESNPPWVQLQPAAQSRSVLKFRIGPKRAEKTDWEEEKTHHLLMQSGSDTTPGSPRGDGLKEFSTRQHLARRTPTVPRARGQCQQHGLGG